MNRPTASVSLILAAAATLIPAAFFYAQDKPQPNATAQENNKTIFPLPIPSTDGQPKIGERVTEFTKEHPKATCFSEGGKISFCSIDAQEEKFNLFPDIPILHETVMFNGDGLAKEIDVDIGSKGTDADRALADLFTKADPSLKDQCVEEAKRTADRLTDYPSAIHDLEWRNAFEAYAAECADWPTSARAWTRSGVTVTLENTFGSNAKVVFVRGPKK